MRRLLSIFIVVGWFLILFSHLNFSLAHAQGAIQWSAPERIPNYLDWGMPPLLLADPSGIVHAINYESPSLAVGEIYYRRWSINRGWEPPVDIILPTLGAGQATVQGGFISSAGVLFVIYYDGSEQIGDIFLTRAHVSVANRAQSWSEPIPIGTSAGPLVAATILEDQRGRIILLYGGQQDGIGLYQVISQDGGETWSIPTAVEIINEKDRWPHNIRMVLDDQGNIHVTWAVVSEQGLGEEVRYARINPQGQWTHSIQIANRTGNEYSTNWPTLISRKNELILVYQDSFPATRWMRISKDYGDTWSTPIRPFPEIGEYGNAVLLKDSADNIYMILGNRTTDPEIHGMWFSRWLGNQWSALDSIISGPMTRVFDPSGPQAVMIQGNLILVTWWNNVGRENMTGVWYSYAYVDAPLIPARTFPAPTQLPTATPAPTSTPAPTLTPTPNPISNTLSQGGFDTAPEPPVNPSLPVYAGILPVLLVVMVVIGWRLLRSSP